MNYRLIPFTSDPDQSMQIVLSIDGVNKTLRLRVRYNLQANRWQLSISDKNGASLVDGIPLVTGQFPAGDILSPYRYLGLGSACVINAGNTTLDSPDELSLGRSFFLMWGDTVS